MKIASEKINIKKYLAALIIFTCFIINSCAPSYEYTGEINLTEHTWLKDIKIFIDPGHGGLGDKDPERAGPSGLHEEEVNLKVALILADMLKKAGANIKLSRSRDTFVTLDDRIKMAQKFKPSLFISIHHNGSALKQDYENYPTILYWGSHKVSAPHFQFAELTLKELEEIMQVKGNVISDFSVYWETGVRMLRKTHNLCVGILTEGGFFSDVEFEKKLKTLSYNEKEAEAFFKAISIYFKKGLPTAEIIFNITKPQLKALATSTPVGKDPSLYIKVDSGTDIPGIKKGSLHVYINHLKVKTKKIREDLYKIEYGQKIPAGGHRVRFWFQNKNNMHSMNYTTAFYFVPKKGQYKNIAAKGIKLIKKGKYKKGLKILLPIQMMLLTNPIIDEVTWHIAIAFKHLGYKGTSAYYFKRIYHFFPQSKYAKKIKNKDFTDYHFPVDNYGKYLSIKYDANFDEKTINHDNLKK